MREVSCRNDPNRIEPSGDIDAYPPAVRICPRYPRGRLGRRGVGCRRRDRKLAPVRLPLRTWRSFRPVLGSNAKSNWTTPPWAAASPGLFTRASKQHAPAYEARRLGVGPYSIAPNPRPPAVRQPTAQIHIFRYAGPDRRPIMGDEPRPMTFRSWSIKSGLVRPRPRVSSVNAVIR